MSSPDASQAPSRLAAARGGKHRRRPASEPEHSKRVRFGKSWGSFNAEQARKLRAGSERVT